MAHVVVQPLGLALIPCAHYPALPKNFEARQGRGIEASDEKLVARAGNAGTHSHLVGMEHRRIRRTLALANGTLVILFPASPHAGRVDGVRLAHAPGVDVVRRAARPSPVCLPPVSSKLNLIVQEGS